MGPVACMATSIQVRRNINNLKLNTFSGGTVSIHGYPLAALPMYSDWNNIFSFIRTSEWF